MKQLVILAGGSGSRLRARLGDLPKPMIPIGGRPLLDIQLALARRFGFSKVLILAHYRAEAIIRHLEGGSAPGMDVRCIVEPEPRGTAGAVLAALDELADDFVVMYGDTMLDVDLDRMWAHHAATGADATLLVHPSDHPGDSDLVETDDDDWITSLRNRPHPADRWYQNLVNAALYVVRRRSIAPWAGAGGKTDFAEGLFPALLRAGGRLKAYRSSEFIKDIGTPERYDRVCALVAAGLLERMRSGGQRPAVFLDRDGTLVKAVEGHGVTSERELELLPGVPAAIRLLNECGILTIVVTNQPVIAKGLCSEDDLATIHRKLETLLGRESAYVDRIYHCPHHPERGFTGERPELKIACDCRKPADGMIRAAARDLDVDLTRSWMIGDSTVDLQCASNAGLRSVLVRTGRAGRDGAYTARPDLEFDSLLEATRHIAQHPG